MTAERAKPSDARPPSGAGRAWRRLRRAVVARLGIRGMGVRGKITLALLGVVALLVPQIVLTVLYMVDLFAAGETLEHYTDADKAVASLRTALQPVIVEPLAFVEAEDKALFNLRDTAVDTALTQLELQSVWQRFAGGPSRVKAARRAVRALQLALSAEVERLDGQPSLKLEVLAVVDELVDGVQERGLRWRLERPEPTAPQTLGRLDAVEQEWLGLRPRVLAAVVVDLAMLDAREGARADARQRIARAKSRVMDALDGPGGLSASLREAKLALSRKVRGKVDDANRYLITLVLLTLVLIALLILLLPGRLVAPLTHLEAVMNAAGRGRLDVQARVVGDDEVGRVSAAFNRMLDRMAVIDDLKRDRIVEDRRRLALLGGRIAEPLAIVDAWLQLEYANDAWSRLFQLGPQDQGRHLGELLAGADREPFLDALERAMRGREAGPLSLSLSTADGNGNDAARDYAVSVTPGRGRSGRIAFAVITLAEERSASGL